MYNSRGEIIMNESFYMYEDHVKIGETIKKLRIQAGISQVKLAEGICDRTTIIHLEKGRAKQPSIYLLNQLCRRLSITLDDFFLIAYNGEVNQLWLKKNEIDALLKTRDYAGAYKIAKRFYNSSIHPVDIQYFGLIEGHYLYSIGQYEKAKEKYLSTLAITNTNIKDEVYTLTEIRIVDGIIHCNRKLDGKFSNPETINYIRILNNSIYNYPMDKDYRIIISLMLNTIHYYFSLKLYKDTITIVNNAIELSNRYSCYDCLGHLWLTLANVYEILGDKDKTLEYYDKSNTFFKLFNEDKALEQSLQHQIEIFQNINC